jgi:hypothetical protein
MNVNVFGILLNLLGLLILFRYGMPFRVPTNGVNYIITETIDEAEKATDRKYEIIGYVGLLFAVAGTIMQAYAAWT